jgi:hypothetical protein
VRVGTRIHNPKPVSSATAGRASGKDLRSTLGHGFAALRADAPREVRFRPAAPYGSGPIQTPLFLNLDAPLHAGAHNIPVHCDPSRARLFFRSIRRAGNPLRRLRPGQPAVRQSALPSSLAWCKRHRPY